jgi:DNA-binding XRE family transcriptional regulator
MGMPNRQGNRLRELRREYGWTLRALGHRVGVSHQTISNLEHDGLRPGTDRDVAWGIANVFGLSIEDVWPEAADLPQFQPPDLARGSPEAIPFATPEAVT